MHSMCSLPFEIGKRVAQKSQRANALTYRQNSGSAAVEVTTEKAGIAPVS